VSIDPLASMRANMRAFYRLLGDRSPGGEVVERAGLLASIVPSCPDRSIVNGVVYDRAEELARAHAELTEAYERAGVRAWTVWVPEADRSAAQLLEELGHRLDGVPRAMTLELANAELAGADAVVWEHTEDLASMASINEAAYGLPAGEFDAAMTAMSGAEVYLARHDGQPAACVGALSHSGDCGIYFVATVPAAQGRGLASALMRQALIEARDAGCSTSSLQATRAGCPIYQRLGYRDVCAIEMWERRDGP
jgi:GNAT superfamily N-acetyltransferase